ncbi:MAG: UDP-N-acetylmuramoyl-L-alanine--D-glutamate ligase [Acidobacteriota bacterium]
MRRFAEELAGRRVAVLGFSRSGRAAAELLLLVGASVVIIEREASSVDETERERLADRGVRFQLGDHHGGQLEGIDYLVVSPGVPPTALPLVAATAAGIPVMGEMELSTRLAVGRLLAVTGTNGKSTTVSLLAEMLSSAGQDAVALGNLGTPLSRRLVEGERRDAVHCLEVSSFQAETLSSVRLDGVIQLNITPDHLDRHGDLDSYAEAKLRLLDLQDGNGIAVLGADDARLRAAAERAQGHVFWFGFGELPGPGLRLVDDVVVSTLDDEETEVFRASSLWSSGRGDLADAMAAATLAMASGVAPKTIRRALDGFIGLPHRRRVLPLGTTGPCFIDDSKATNVAAAVASISGSPEGVVVILGGRHAGGDLTPVIDALAERDGRAVLLGRDRPQFEETIGERLPWDGATTLPEAVTLAAEAAGAEGTVLLAPACASLDMFTNFEERGRVFEQAARDYLADASA